MYIYGVVNDQCILTAVILFTWKLVVTELNIPTVIGKLYSTLS